MRPKLYIPAPIVFVGLLCFATFVAEMVTLGYYVAVMPQLPQPTTGRIYLVVFSKIGAVYVNKNEIAWANFLRYDMMTIVGVAVVLVAIFVIVPKARRRGRV